MEVPFKAPPRAVAVPQARRWAQPARLTPRGLVRLRFTALQAARAATGTGTHDAAVQLQPRLHEPLAELLHLLVELGEVAEQEGRHAGKVSISVEDIARSSETTVDAIHRSDNASQRIGELLAALQAKAAQFKV